MSRLCCCGYYRADITIDTLRLSNVFCSTETATLECNKGYWDDDTNDPFNIINNKESNLHGNLLEWLRCQFYKYAKNYRFNIGNESLVLINAIEPGRIVISLINIPVYIGE